MNSKAILAANKTCQIEFSEHRWKRVNKKAIHLITGMTAKKPKDRISVNFALRHPWFRENLSLD